MMKGVEQDIPKISIKNGLRNGMHYELIDMILGVKIASAKRQRVYLSENSKIFNKRVT